MSRPACALKAAKARWVPVPLPVEPKLYLPGAAFTLAMKSWTFLASMTSGLIASTLGTSTMVEIGVKSASTSKPSL